MGRSGVAPDEVGGLLRDVGCGDVDAFAALYDRTASVVFGLLQHTLGESGAERIMVRVYAQVWRTAPTFDPTVTSGGGFLMQAVYRELARDRKDRRAHIGRAGSWSARVRARGDGPGHPVAAALRASVASASDSSRPTRDGSSTSAQPGPATKPR